MQYFIRFKEPIDLIEAKKRRRRLNSAGSDVCDMDHKYKKMKKKKIKVDVKKYLLLVSVLT